MDISHHKLTSTPFWDPYGLSTMDDHHLIQDQTLFHHHTQWPFYPQIIEPSNSGCSQLIASTNLLGLVDHHHRGGENPSVVEQQGEPEEQEEEDVDDEEELGAMKEMMFRIAAMQPIDIDPATICKPRRRNVRISKDPQSVAARHRRERISEKVRILQRLVPGGTKMDTASMLDEAIRYVKFLKRQIRMLQGNHRQHHHQHQPPCNISTAVNANPTDDWVV